MQNFAAEIQRKEAAITIEKENGTLVDYYLQKEFEVHNNVIPPGVVQDWHAHLAIEEMILILDGQITLEQVQSRTLKQDLLKTGDFVCLKNSIHRFVNNHLTTCHFVVFRFTADKSVVIKDDKLPITEEEITALVEPTNEKIEKIIEHTEQKKANFLKAFLL